MALSLRSKLSFVALTASLLTAGCADYTNRWDTISARAGNAPEANTAIQEITAWPPNVENTTIEAGG